MGKQSQPRVAIIGCGLGGITLALTLKKKLGFTNFTIYERTTDSGGTWRDNTYPGCACDVPSHEYCLSSELNPYWSKVYSPQPEIQAYWKGIYNKHKLAQFTQFDANFVGAEWDVQKQLYHIHFTKTSDSSQKFDIDADILVSCIGGFSKPADEPPSLPGLTSFKGERFHSARWNHDVQLKGKTVGVIGNGCSATQFVPEIAKDKSTNVVNFSRSPAWFMPRPQRAYTSFEKWVFAHVPFVMRLYKFVMRRSLDLRFYVWMLRFSWARHLAEERSIKHITSTAPAKYHDFLIPTYPFGCKRVILDPGYLKCLNQSNVELITDPIQKVTENGILGKSGKEYKLDVIILGTGFSLGSETLGLDVKGRNGITLTNQWQKQGGPQSYLGTTVNGYPNFYMILGPNVATGHASVTYSTESQVNYITKMIGTQLKNKIASFEVKADAETRYMEKLTKGLDGTVWAGNCTTYYKLDNGKIIATFPGRLGQYESLTKNPVWADYIQRGGVKRLAVTDLRNTILKTVFVVLAIWRIRAYGFNRALNKIIMFLLMRYSDLMGYLNP